MKREVQRAGWDELTSWCERHLEATPLTELFEKSHLSSVIGLRLSNRQEVVVKVRPRLARLNSCARIHRHLWQSGYPCPEPVVQLEPLGNLVASAEAFQPEGSMLSGQDASPRLFARALQQLIVTATSFSEPFDLSPPSPWVGWEHEEAGIWPQADDRDDDLNEAHEPAWLDDMGRRLRERLLADENPRVIGHGDWWQPNIRWQGADLYCVFDWDSVVYLSEAAIAGAASASFSVQEWGATTIEESAAFLDAYAEARGLQWSPDELEIAWAAGLWQLAFNAKKDVLNGVQDNLSHLQEFGGERLKRAGAS